MNDTTEHVPSLGLIILCGGESRRMGQNKVLLPWSGSHTLLTYMIQKGIDAGFTDIVLAVGPQGKGKTIEDSLKRINSAHSMISIAYDAEEHKGPLVGIYSALGASTSEYNAVVAVDMPFIDLVALRTCFVEQVCNGDTQYDVWVPLYSAHNGDITHQVSRGSEISKEPMESKEANKNKEITWEPLGSIYHKRVIGTIETLLREGRRSVHALLHVLNERGRLKELWSIDVAHGLDFHNVNYYDDYQWARAAQVNRERKVPVISVVSSRRKTGKTTVVTALIEAFSERGYNVGVVKSDSHGFDMDRPGSDTNQSIKAGAAVVAIAGPTETAIRIKEEKQTNIYELSQRLPVDMVLIETRSQGIFPIIEVTRKDHTEELISSLVDRLALVDLDELSHTLPALVESIIIMMNRING